MGREGAGQGRVHPPTRRVPSLLERPRGFARAVESCTPLSRRRGSQPRPQSRPRRRRDDEPWAHPRIPVPARARRYGRDDMRRVPCCPPEHSFSGVLQRQSPVECAGIAVRLRGKINLCADYHRTFPVLLRLLEQRPGPTGDDYHCSGGADLRRAVIVVLALPLTLGTAAARANNGGPGGVGPGTLRRARGGRRDGRLGERHGRHFRGQRLRAHPAQRSRLSLRRGGAHPDSAMPTRAVRAAGTATATRDGDSRRGSGRTGAAPRLPRRPRPRRPRSRSPRTRAPGSRSTANRQRSTVWRPAIGSSRCSAGPRRTRSRP